MERVLNFKKGDRCIISDCGVNIGRRKGYKTRTLENLEEWTTEGIITSVGRKYIKAKAVNSSWETTFVIEDNYREKYTYGCADYILYDSIEAIKEKFELEKCIDNIRSKFGGYGYWIDGINLDKAKRIIDIINEEE